MTEKTLQLERLCSNLAAAKHAEGEAKRQRLQFEDEISALIATKEEGVDTLDAGGFTVSVTSKPTVCYYIGKTKLFNSSSGILNHSRSY